MLDTNIVSYVVTGRYPMVRRRLDAEESTRICVSVITRAELLFGLKRLPADHPRQSDVRNLLERSQVLAWDERAADVHAAIRHQLQSAGQPIGEMDTMIAAHAISLGAVLVTNNTRHFARIAPPLQLENWAIDGGG